MRIVLVLLLGACAPVRVPRAALEGESTLTVVTWNVNYGLAQSSEDLDEATRDADVVLLQETNVAWELRLSESLRGRFPHQAWLDDAAAGGQAVLSKRPFTHEVLPAEHGWFPAMRVEVDGVQILNVHLHPPIADDGSLIGGYLGTGPTRRRELSGFFASLDSKLPTLIVGDFNEGTSGDAISWSADRKFRSALPEFTPNAKTWHWPVTKSLELRAQFDHVLYGPGLEPLSAEVMKLGHSDHFPVRVMFTRGNFKLTPRPSGGSLGIYSAR